MSYFNYYPASRMFHGSRMSVMGTRLDVLLMGERPEQLQKIWSEIENEVLELDKLLSRFDPKSEVFRINRYASSYPVDVSGQLWEILADCRYYYELTDGYFDVTLHNFDLISFSESSNSLFFNSGDLRLDFGGYAKGYALNRIKEILDIYSVNSALINFGNSSVYAHGSHPYGSHWEIGIENPYGNEPVGSVRLCSSSLSVSGNIPGHFRHIKNPHTGRYEESRKMVSVVARDPLIAEILSTTLMIADEKEAGNIISKLDINEKHIYTL
ncbi:FAD:protein FMN transferase [Coprobacter sp.]